MHHCNVLQACRLLLLLLPVLLPGKAAAQRFLVADRHWTVEDGLPHREVNTLVKDSRGFVWAATPDGLCRMDGYKLQGYGREAEGYLNGNFYNILEDAEGYFWLIPLPPYSDIDIWHPVTGELTSFKRKFGAKAELPETRPENWSVTAVGGTIVAATSSPARLIRYHPSQGLQTLPVEGAEKLQLVAAGESTWVLADNSRLILVGPQGKITKEIWQNPSAGKFNIAVENSRLPLVFYTYDGLITNIREAFVLDRQENCIPLKGRHVAPHLVPAATHPGIGEDLLLDGGKIVSLSGEVLHEIYPDWTEEKGSQFRSALFDDNGILWAGGDFGIHQVVVRKNVFQSHFTSTPGYEAPATRGILVNKGWLVANRDSHAPVAKRLSDQSELTLYTQRSFFEMSSLLPLASGDFAAAQNGAVNVFSADLKPMRWYPSLLNIYAMAEPFPSTLYLGTVSRGLKLLDLGSGAITDFRQLNGFDNLSQAHVYHIGRVDSQTFGVCTNRGFFILDKLKGVLERYSSLDTGRHYLPFDHLRHFDIDNDGSFWLATAGQGLVRLLPANLPLEDATSRQGRNPDDKTSHFSQYSWEQGLSNNTLHAVYSDDYGRLWMSSNFGLMAFDKKSGQVHVFLEQDGITHNEFNQFSHFRDAEGRLYFGGLNGITSFHPRDLLNPGTTGSAPLAILSYQKFDGKTGALQDLTAELIREGRIVLQPGDRFLQLDFSLLNYLNTDKTRYAWQLAGLEDSWNHTEDHTLRFGRLPYGRYRLLVKAMDAWGRWSDSTVDIEVLALRPFYLRLWFLALTALLAAAAMLAYIRYSTHSYRQQQRLLEREVSQRTEVIRQQAEELRSLEQLKSRFFTNVSHELRTPLSLMLGPIDSLMKKHARDERELRLLKLLKGNTRHLLALVNEILDLSKLENDKLEVVLSTVRLHDFLLPLVAQFSTHGEDERIGLVFQYAAGEELAIRMDQGKVEKILHNLLSNAFKYSPANGKVFLKVRDEPSHLSIEVQDQGPGIHPDDLPRIFDRFFQSSRPEAQAKGGSGIGLALCRELAQLLNAKLWAESMPGKGSSFFFELPKMPPPGARDGHQPEIPVGEESDDAATPAHPKLDRDKKGLQQRATLLLVEDNSGLREYISIQLGDEYDLQTAGNGKIAWDLLQSGTAPDLIITDLMMPEMDGAGLLRLVKADDRLRHLPVIVLTARTDVQVKLEMLRIGVDDYLVKPFLEEELRVRIRNLLRHLRLRVHHHAESEREDGTHEKPVISAADAEWLAAVEMHFMRHLSEADFNMDSLGSEMAISERQLRRRITQLTGLSPNLYLRELRMQTARDYLQQGKYRTVKETSFAVGFSKVTHFSRLYLERFGILPSAYFSSGRNSARI